MSVDKKKKIIIMLFNVNINVKLTELYVTNKIFQSIFQQNAIKFIL